MARQAAQRSDEERRQILAEQRASGLSVVAFAREPGLSAWTIHDRRRRLGERAADQDKVDFVQMTVAPSAPRAATFAVEVGAGIHVHVPAGFDAAELRRLQEVLASC